MAGQSVAVKILSNNLTGAVQARVRAQIRDEVAKAAADVEANAKANAPVRTGTLRRSYHTEMAADGQSATVGSAVEYAPYVEFGTRHQSAQPHLLPAYERAKPKLLAAVRRILADAGR